MRLYCDLHLHSCLSPCGDGEMTPYNLVNMAKLLGYDIIALTDHNTAGNCCSALRAGEAAGITVVPGMELCTSEEIHVVCLFPTLEGAEEMGRRIYSLMPPVQNRSTVFGGQVYMDHTDRVLGQEERLLITAAGLSIEEVRGVVGEYDGVCYPAHIDRPAYSILSALGVFPPELGFGCAELSLRTSPQALLEEHPELEGLHLFHASDAHRLEHMEEASRTVELEENTAASLIRMLRRFTGGLQR